MASYAVYRCVTDRGIAVGEERKQGMQKMLENRLRNV